MCVWAFACGLKVSMCVVCCVERRGEERMRLSLSSCTHTDLTYAHHQAQHTTSKQNHSKTADAFGVDEEDTFSDRFGGPQFQERILELGRVTKVSEVVQGGCEREC